MVCDGALLLAVAVAVAVVAAVVVAVVLGRKYRAWKLTDRERQAWG